MMSVYLINHTRVYYRSHSKIKFQASVYNATPDVMPDFIEGVDAVPDRIIVDFTKNMYGEFLSVSF